MSYIFTKEKIEKYYTDSFTSDLFNYFDIANGEYCQNSNKHCVVENTYFKSLHCSGVANEGEVTPICYWWLSKEKDYIFSALFAYLYVAQKCIANNAEKSVVLEFNRDFSFPEARDLCPNGYFDVVIALKEAMLAPTQKEAKSYMCVLDEVIQYMNGLLSNFLSNKEHSDNIITSINRHLDDFRQWITTNTDEIVSFYGLLLRKESTDSLFYQRRYVMLESFVDISEANEIYSLHDLVERPLWAPSDVPSVSFLEDPITANYHDIEFVIKYNNSDNNTDDPLHWRENPNEENQRYLFNTIDNFLWQDEKFCRKGKYGLQDCWGRVIVPAEFEDCIGGLSDAYNILPDEMIIGVKKGKKWGFVKRSAPLELVIPYTFDYIENRLNGVYLTVVAGEGIGIMSKLGKELLPPVMQDIDKQSFIGDIMYKHNDGYGFILHNGASSTEYFEDIDISSGRLLMVRRKGVWGYIDNNAQFSINRENAVINVDFSFDSDVKHIKKEYLSQNNNHQNVDDIESNEGGNYLPMEEFEDYLSIDNILLQAGTRMNFKEDSLSEIATVIMGFGRGILHFRLDKEQKTFAINLSKPYKLDLITNESFDFVSSWNGYDEEKNALRLWLNDINPKSGVRNWAECIYACNHNRDDKVLIVEYAENKDLDFSGISDREFETYDFPAIEFVN